MVKKFVKYEIQPTTIGQYDLPVVEFVKSADITIIPPDFIDTIEVEYNNGAIIRINGEDVDEAIIIGESNTAKKEELFKNVSHITVMINFDEFQKHLDFLISDMFQRFGIATTT